MHTFFLRRSVLFFVPAVLGLSSCAPADGDLGSGDSSEDSGNETGGGNGESPRATGGDSGQDPAGTGGANDSASAGGSDPLGSGGFFDSGSGGGSSAGGSPAGTGGENSTVDSDGCPLTQVGFSMTEALGQSATTGGEGGPVVTVTSQAELEAYAGQEAPVVIRVDGVLTISPKGREIRVSSDKTILGVGANSGISQGGFFVGEGMHNIIFRNLTISDTFVEGDWEGKTQDFDGIQLDTAHHVWIDHCEFHHLGDGIIDSRKDTTNLTVSWNILRDQNKAFGIGWTENVTAEMTIHHNIIRDTYQRNPSTDNVLRAHLYNNWLLRVESYGNYARGGTNMVLENSVFESVNHPHYYDTGTLVAIGNSYSSASGQQESSGSAYSFFDPSDHYEYDLDATSEVKTLLSACAGPRASLGN